MFTHDLNLYGPDAPQSTAISLPEARLYCRNLAQKHYENFTVVSFLLPRHLRQHFSNVYAYCRWADDLADEIPDPEKSLVLLNWWENQLRNCFNGKTQHPVFIALAETIQSFNIPIEPFANLLTAFRQDQNTKQYETFEELLQYCRYSANPVGHLVLYLGNCFSAEYAKLADSICTGLQLANFWQDVAQDLDRGRIYLPQEDCRRFGYTAEMFGWRENNDLFHNLIQFQVNRAEEYLQAGRPLIETLPQKLKLDVTLFIEGGLAILRAIRRQNYNVWTHRPTVSKIEKLWIFTDCWWRNFRQSHKHRS